MGTKLTADEIVQLQHVRGFIQFGEPGPDHDLQYYGKSAQYFFVESLSAPELGSISPTNVPDPGRRRAFRLVGRQVEAPDLPSYSLVLLEKHGKVPRALGRIGCEFNMYLSVGRCKEPSDPDRGWEDYWHVLEGGIVSDKDHGNRMGMTDDSPLQSTLTVTLADEYAAGPLGFGPGAATNITAEAIDATYGVTGDCDDCGADTDRIYVLVGPDAGSPAASPKVVYSTHGTDGPWTDLAITGIGVAAAVAAIRQVGPYLVVLVPGEDAYYYTEINDLTGAPSSTWTQVASGIVAAGTPNDMYVASPVETWLCGDMGYLYKITDITVGAVVVSAGDATVENLARIDGVDEVIVAVGANGAIVKSEDSGLTFATTTSNGGVSDNLTALAVNTPRRFWFGTDAGEVWWTKTAGEEWAQQVVDSALIAIQEIRFPTLACGYITGTIAGPTAQIHATTNGGRTWNKAKTRIKNTPVADRFNRIATPNSISSQTNVNNLVIAGLAGNGADGIALIGAAAEL
jgi:photosystem II stability/assembly factor-like uncharacterized protein